MVNILSFSGFFWICVNTIRVFTVHVTRLPLGATRVITVHFYHGELCWISAANCFILAASTELWVYILCGACMLKTDVSPALETTKYSSSVVFNSLLSSPTDFSHQRNLPASFLCNNFTLYPRYSSSGLVSGILQASDVMDIINRIK